MKHKHFRTLLSIILLCNLIPSNSLLGQGIEGMIVEEVDASSALAGATSYRVYIDLADGYQLQSVYGNQSSPMNISTTTEWYNDGFGSVSGEGINSAIIDAFPTAAFDSYVSTGGASSTQLGVQIADDMDGTADGRITGSPTSTTVADPSNQISDAFGAVTNSSTNVSITTVAGATWATIDDNSDQTPGNLVLVGQFTTTGDLALQLNVQIRNTTTLTVEKYVASNPLADEVLFEALNFPLVQIDGCTDPTACNYNPDATDDDGSCIIPVANCTECNMTNDGLDLIDVDNDGICDLNDDTGCTDPMGCNYNQFATNDDGTCLLPEDNCWECDGAELVIIDSDNDGICDAEDVEGCTDPDACNYNPDAIQDDGSCDVPDPDCEICDGNMSILDPASDTNNNGICDSLEIMGCTDDMACNYDDSATFDDGSCLIPDPDCEICENGVPVLDPAADLNMNGICDILEGGFEQMVVEIYYVSDSTDAEDTDGGELPVHSVTYRVYMDLAQTTEFQAVYGNAVDNLFIDTSTEFFNNEDRGEVYGGDISFIHLDANTVALDSYLTIGAGSSNHIGVLKTNDGDGSIVGGMNNDGGSEGVAEGLLINNEPGVVDIPLTDSDGLVLGTAPSITAAGMDAANGIFGDVNAAGPFEINDVVGGTWSVAPSFVAPAPDNHVLVGQFTTDGEFEFCMNIQIRIPQMGGQFEVQTIPNLCYEAIPGCTIETALNYDPEATVNNGSCQVDIGLVEDFNLIENFDLYPNPANDEIVMELELENGIEALRYDIMDVTGKTISRNSIESNTLNIRERIDINQLERGVYFINLMTDQGYLTSKKFVKQ